MPPSATGHAGGAEELLATLEVVSVVDTGKGVITPGVELVVVVVIGGVVVVVVVGRGLVMVVVVVGKKVVVTS